MVRGRASFPVRGPASGDLPGPGPPPGRSDRWDEREPVREQGGVALGAQGGGREAGGGGTGRGRRRSPRPRRPPGRWSRSPAGPGHPRSGPSRIPVRRYAGSGTSPPPPAVPAACRLPGALYEPVGQRVRAVPGARGGEAGGVGRDREPLAQDVREVAVHPTQVSHEVGDRPARAGGHRGHRLAEVEGPAHRLLERRRLGPEDDESLDVIHTVDPARRGLDPITSSYGRTPPVPP